MVTLRTASEFFVKPFPGLLDKTLDDPALFHRLIELAAALFRVAHARLDLDVLFVREPAQMPLEEV